MKKFAKILFSFALLLWVPFMLVACGGESKSGKTITNFEFENQFVTIKYNQALTEDPFGTMVVYSDGTKVKLDELGVDDIVGLDATITKFNPDTNQDEEWDMSQKMTVGNYTVTYTYGSNIKGSASLYVEKADYTGNVYPQMTINRLTYGGALARPSVSFTLDRITNIIYYYQEKTADGSYREDWVFEYEYSDTATCYLTPGDYQLYAVIQTENYNDIKTALREFKVDPATLTKNYAFFTSVWNDVNQEWEYLPLGNNPYEVTWHDYQSEKISDYVKNCLHDLYIFEVDDQGDIALDEEGNQVHGTSVSSAYNDGLATLASQDSDVTAAGTFNINLNFTPDAMFYKEKRLSMLRLQVNKLKAPVSKIIQIYVDESSVYQGEVEYNGLAHHLAMSARKENGQWYGYATYYGYQGNETYLNLYTISNYERTDAGTYNVVCQVLPSLTNCVELEWTEEGQEQSTTGSFVSLGTWRITPKGYNIEADVLLNGNPLSNYVVNDNVTVLCGEEYAISLNNLVAKYGEDVDTTITPVFDRIRALVNNGEDWVEATDVTIDNDAKTVTISSDCTYDYAQIQFTFNLGSANYKANEFGTYIYFKHGVHYTGNVYGTIQNAGYYNDQQKYDYKFKYTKTNSGSYGDEYFFSTDEETYTKWTATTCQSLYVASANEGEYDQNTNATIDWGKTYYKHINNAYVPVDFYFANIEYTHEVTQNGNNVSFDAKIKDVDGEISLTGIDVLSWAENYNNVYTGEYISVEMVYTKNTSSDIDFSADYYKKVGDDYVRLYICRAVDGGYVRTYSEVDGATYYLATESCYLTKRIENALEKKVGETWVAVSEAREVGQYRIWFRVVFLGEEDKILLDAQGNYVTEVCYEWNIVDDLPRIQVTSYEFTFKDKNGNVLTPNNGTITLDYSDGPVYLTASVTLSNNVEYVLMYQYYGSDVGGASGAPQFWRSGEYVVRLSVVLDGEYVLTDSNGNAIEWIETEFTLVINNEPTDLI